MCPEETGDTGRDGHAIRDITSAASQKQRTRASLLRYLRPDFSQSTPFSSTSGLSSSDRGSISAGRDGAAMALGRCSAVRWRAASRAPTVCCGRCGSAVPRKLPRLCMAARLPARRMTQAVSPRVRSGAGPEGQLQPGESHGGDACIGWWMGDVQADAISTGNPASCPAVCIWTHEKGLQADRCTAADLGKRRQSVPMSVEWRQAWVVSNRHQRIAFDQLLWGCGRQAITKRMLVPGRLQVCLISQVQASAGGGAEMLTLQSVHLTSGLHTTRRLGPMPGQGFATLGRKQRSA